jgi:CheY-like chemotaxis protein
VGSGSVFGIMMRSAEATQSKEAALISPQDELKGKRVALLDDDPDVLESLGGLLQSWGMDVSFVLSAEMLQELAEDEGGFDFVVSDYHLGLESENGLDVIRAAIQAAPLKPPYCILLTGDTRTELAQEAVQAGAYLWHKPIRPTRLRAHLNGVVQQQNPL